jgi:hypothetical protein
VVFNIKVTNLSVVGKSTIVRGSSDYTRKNGLLATEALSVSDGFFEGPI